MRDKNLDILFEPLEMRNLYLDNRFYMAPMGTGFSIEQLRHFYTARARGGVALITTGETCVHPSGRAILKNEQRIETDDEIKQYISLTEAVHKAGSKIVLQLNHAGRYSPSNVLGHQAVAPSAVMSGYTGETPRELTTQEADNLVTAFAEAALRARKAGFDGVEILGSSGYLISQFFSPVTNKRQDKYGGDALGRASFALSIIREARKLVGNDFNICIKFDADDGMAGGVTLDDSRIFAPALVEAGADRLHIWAGWHESTRPMLPMSVSRGAFSKLASSIREVVNVPVSAVGRINDPYVAAGILVRGEADLIGLGRTLLADPDFVRKTREGLTEQIRRCTACCYCFDRLMPALRSGGESSIMCSINPELGHEGEVLKSAKRKKRVVIIGAGPAGMEAARTAGMRGHNVIMYDREKQTGGMLNQAVIPPFKEELKNILEYYNYELKRLRIDTRIDTEINIDKLGQERPDSVIIATGARTNIPDVAGVDKYPAVTAVDVLRGNVEVGENAVIIGGGMIGLETGEYLAEKGKKVTLIEMDILARDVGPVSRWGLISRTRGKIEIHTRTKLLEVKESSVVVLGKDNKQREFKADTIIFATGMKSNNEIVRDIALLDIEYFLAGSCNEPGQIADAIHDGYSVGCLV